MIAAVLERNPRPISTLQPASPPTLDRVVKTCLAKDPDERWRSVHDIELQLAGLREDSQSGAEQVAARPTNTREKLAWSLVALLMCALGFAALTYLRHPVPAALPVRSSILPPAHWSFLVNNMSLSPDGTRLAFTGVGPNGETTLWVRSITTGGVQQLNGTENATVPFWSADSTRIGFFADGKLKTTEANGAGLPKILADATFGRGGSWNREGTIVFAPDMFGSLYRISENGGAPSPATKKPDTGQAHRWPFFLPDGKHFLFGIDWSSPQQNPGNGIYVGSLEGGDPKLITAESAGNAVFASGKLLYVHDLTLLAQPFDPGRLETTGIAAPVSEQQVVTHSSFSNSAFSVSASGMLAFQSVADSASQLAWFSSKGEQIGQVPAVGPADPRLSPDGRFVVFASDEAGNGKTYIRVYDLARDVSTRLTDGGGDEGPTWSRDGKEIAYIGNDRKTYALYQIAADGSGSPQSLLKGARMRGVEWPERDHFLFSDFSSGRPSLAVLSLADHKVIVLHPGAEARISPDRQWVLYTRSSGRPLRPDVFVEPFPGPGGRIQISRAGGAQGTWSPDGKQIFFIAPDKKMMAVTFDARTPSVSAPRVLFQTRIVAPNFILRQYDVAADGRFLINSLPLGSAPPIALMTNWTGHNSE